MTTSAMSWSQDYIVNVTYACGSTGEEIWTADICLAEVLTTSSKVTTEYLPCTPILIPEITATCASNPGCAGIGLPGNW